MTLTLDWSAATETLRLVITIRKPLMMSSRIAVVMIAIPLIVRLRQRLINARRAT